MSHKSLQQLLQIGDEAIAEGSEVLPGRWWSGGRTRLNQIHGRHDDRSSAGRD
jgi:hypothetical protein